MCGMGAQWFRRETTTNTSTNAKRNTTHRPTMAKQYWVYHERQEALLCGQHALNNLVQQNAFSAGSLAEIASQLDAMELNYMAQNDEGGVSSKDYLKRMAEGSGNVDESGNFSIEVLRSALMGRFDLELPNIRQQGVGDKVEITEIDGFVSV